MGKLIERVKQSWWKRPGRTDGSMKAGSAISHGKPDNSKSADGDGRNGKLVVVGRESEFPRDLVEYALDMAERLSYEIVALSTAPLSCETFKFFSSSRSKLCEDFQSLAEQSAATFRNEVAQRGLAFTHVVKFSEVDRALKDLQNEIGDIDFIVSDAKQDTIQEPTGDDRRPESEIVVYAML